MPVTAEEIAIVKSTVPLLETGGVTLTTHFYKLMLSSYPEVRTLFNQANQEDGRQPRALAQAVLCYAKYIDALEHLGDLVPRIIHKHVALNVLPEHYPIVGKCLLQAIREVLGEEVATDAVISAWASAYGQLADLLISLEEQLYAEAAAVPGGWRGARDFLLAEKIPEGSEISTFVLRPADGGAVKSFTPGQYIGLRVELPDGTQTQRNYSLSSSPRDGEYRITVRHHDHGVVSRFIHALPVGGKISLFPPAGAFQLDADLLKDEAADAASSPASPSKILLVAGGIGITPLAAMAEALSTSPRASVVEVLHSCKHGDDHPLRESLIALRDAKNPIGYEFVYTRPREGNAEDAKSVGRITEAYLQEHLPASGRSIVYVVGPTEFMRDIRRDAIACGVAPEDVRYEFFGPHEALETELPPAAAVAEGA